MSSETLFRILQAAVFIAFVFHRAYYTRKYPPQENQTETAQEDTPLQKIANLLALPAFLSLLAWLIQPRWMAWSALPLPDWTRWVGVALALGGFILLEASHRALGRNWSDQPRTTTSQSLVTDGPYRRVRHPIYTAFLMILGSSLLISANWFIGGLWLGMTALDIFSRVQYEEKVLQEKFGADYEEYFRQTGALLPRIRR